MTTLQQQAALDAAAIIGDGIGMAQTIQIDGGDVQAIVLDGFDNSEGDPRSPIVVCLESDLAGVTRPTARVVIGGSSYAVEGYQPNGNGLAELRLGVPK